MSIATRPITANLASLARRVTRFTRAQRTSSLLRTATVVAMIAAGLAATQSPAAAPAQSPTWMAQSATSGLTGREGASVAYDPSTSQLLMFGGDNANTALGDTWIWTGSTWSQLSPSTSPSARYLASMAYDPALGQLVLFGGSNGTSNLSHTWTWNGTTWAQRSPSTSPGARDGAAMAYDDATGQLVMFGGLNGTQLGDTWVFSGPTWTQLSPSTSPSARYAASMSYDPATAQVVLFGGVSASGFQADTWLWTGSTWVSQSPSVSPSARGGAGMAYSPATAKLVLIGGFNGSGDASDTWTYAFPAAPLTANTWNAQTPGTSPSARENAAVAYDPATGQLVLFGGFDASGSRNDTWTFNGSTWTQQSPSTSPPARYSAMMAYDPKYGQFILFGGTSGTNPYLNDTWSWTGTNWVQLSPSTVPSGTLGAVLAYDSAAGQMVMFGGSQSSGASNSTYLWSGSNWVLSSPTASPPARYLATMAFDPALGQLVLFGGRTGSGVILSDTWTYNGTTWTQLSPATSPSGAMFASMDYDPAIGSLVLFGGYNAQLAVTNQTWTFDGTTWTLQSPSTSPTAQAEVGSAYDPAVGGMLLFGGWDGNNLNANTWLYQSVAVPQAGGGGAGRVPPVPVRVWGPDRFGTAIAASAAEFPGAGTAKAVVLVRSDSYADAVTGSVLAASKDGPLLFVGPAGPTAATLAEISRVLPAGGAVYVLGGTSAVPAGVVSELTGLHYAVTRLGGADRVATALAVAAALGDPGTVVLATGTGFADPLVAGAAAAHLGGAVLLTDGTVLPAEVRAYLASHPGTVYAVGGPAAAADPAATPLTGPDRYATSANVATTLFNSPANVGVASGVDFPDALAGGAFEAHAGGPLLLTDPAVLPASVESYLAAATPNLTTVDTFGGTSVLSPATQSAIAAAVQ